MHNAQEVYYVHHNGHSWFVKTESFFKEQLGHEQPWGEAWTPILAGSIEDARTKAAATLG